MYYPLMLITLVFFVFTSSCDRGNHIIWKANNPSSDNLDSMKVIIPYDQMTAVLHGEIISDASGEILSRSNKYKLLRYIDEDECSICQIKSLYQWDEIMDLIGRERLDLLLIICPGDSLMVSATLSVLQQYYFSYPVWFDEASRFTEVNIKLCQSHRRKCFLIDPEGNLVYCGDPTINISSREKIADIVYVDK